MTSTEPAPNRRKSSVPKFFAVVFGLLLVGGMVFAVVNSWRQADTNYSAPIEKFSAVLQRHGLSGQEPRNMTGAVKIAHQNTYEVTVADKPVWLVYFDPFDPTQAAARQQVERDGAIEIDGQSYQTKVRGVVALAGYQGHDDEQKLLAAFADFQTPGK